MKDIGKQESSIEIESILMLESSFSRQTNVIFDTDQIESHTHLNVDIKAPSENTRVVILTLQHTQQVTETRLEQVKVMVKQVGVFNQKTASELDFDQFAKINAPAIMLPYIREMITNMSIRASISPIYIDPVNFVNLASNNP
ncbi:MAG: protein-export chaperone SecB [Chitinophagaceae bacterium]